MSSNPGFHQSRHPRRHYPYRVCIECSWQFTPESETQMMCRLCQVDLSYHATHAEVTMTCHECNQPFTRRARAQGAKYCSDACRAARKLKRKAVTYAAKHRLSTMAPRVCAREGCDTMFTPGSASSRYCAERCRAIAKNVRRSGRTTERTA